ncbi:MAG: hypothetical protein DHS20C18_03150 [Saprospiraceae bacterium]|nr:MAG: hypothetical protein DHS20C18_03150 [Saprospiraceae bacterium]
MYKIYINETPLMLRDTKDLSDLPISNDVNFVARYAGKPKMLLSYADMLEKNTNFETVTLYSQDYEKLARDFESNYKVIEAAGGLVFHSNGQALFIFRSGYWDLPKGKIEKGEIKEDAAIREVQEETGLQQLDLKEFLGTTHHTYRGANGKRILKRTFWYRMQTEERALIPQTEEDIEKAEWMDLEVFLKEANPVYKNIIDVISWYKRDIN